MTKEEIILKLNNNEIGIIPTDTIFGIVTKVGNLQTEKKIFKIKKRSKNKKLPILVSSFEQLKEFIEIDDNIKKFFEELTEPTTIVFESKNKKKEKETIAIRMVKWEWLKDIIDKTGPLFATSCNISGKNEFNNLYFWLKKVDFIELNEKTCLVKCSKIIEYKTKKYIR